MSDFTPYRPEPRAPEQGGGIRWVPVRKHLNGSKYCAISAAGRLMTFKHESSCQARCDELNAGKK